MAPAIEHGLKLSSSADVERAHTLRPVKLVARDGQQVAPDFIDIDRDLARRLHGIGVEVNVGLGSNLSDFCDGLHDAGLVVGEHDGDQLRIRPERALHIRRIHQAAAIHGKIGYLASLRCQMLAGVEYGVMFDGGSDDVGARARQTKYRKIVGFRTAAGKYDFRGAAAEQCGHGFARALDRGPRLLPMMVDGRSVPKALAKIRPHGLQHLGEHRSSRVVVEIDPSDHAAFYCTDIVETFGARIGLPGSPRATIRLAWKGARRTIFSLPFAAGGRVDFSRIPRNSRRNSLRQDCSFSASCLLSRRPWRSPTKVCGYTTISPKIGSRSNTAFCRRRNGWTISGCRRCVLIMEAQVRSCPPTAWHLPIITWAPTASRNLAPPAPTT